MTIWNIEYVVFVAVYMYAYSKGKTDLTSLLRFGRFTMWFPLLRGAPWSSEFTVKIEGIAINVTEALCIGQRLFEPLCTLVHQNVAQSWKNSDVCYPKLLFQLATSKFIRLIHWRGCSGYHAKIKGLLSNDWNSYSIKRAHKSFRAWHEIQVWTFKDPRQRKTA